MAYRLSSAQLATVVDRARKNCINTFINELVQFAEKHCTQGGKNRKRNKSYFCTGQRCCKQCDQFFHVRWKGMRDFHQIDTKDGLASQDCSSQIIVHLMWRDLGVYRRCSIQRAEPQLAKLLSSRDAIQAHLRSQGMFASALANALDEYHRHAQINHIVFFG